MEGRGSEQGRWEASVHARCGDGGLAVEEEVEECLYAGSLHTHHRLWPVVNADSARPLT